jgi:TonB family protein
MIAVLFLATPAAAQSTSSNLQHVRWPLLDMVMVPDSAGLWFLVAPNPATMQWESGSHLADLRIDPIISLQWVTIARKLVTSTHQANSEPARQVTPPLQAKQGPDYILLARNPEKAAAERVFIFAVSDSARQVKWRAEASLAQVEALLNALDRVASDSRTSAGQFFGGTTHPEHDEPVQIVSQPKPKYPSRLASRGRVGRVWMAYDIGANGRVIQGTFRPLLSDDILFTQAAIQALLRSRFKPAMRNGQPVSQRVFQVILFRVE